LHVRGTIFHHNRLEYSDGTSGQKFIILLNTPSRSEPYLFVKATSQKKDKPSSPGCIRTHSAFFIPAAKTFFPKDTWVQLHEIYPIKRIDIDQNKDIKKRDILDSKLMEDIIDCLFETEGDNIPPINRKLLRPPIQESITKLKDFFASR
jgi:hypothetical protein